MPNHLTTIADYIRYCFSRLNASTAYFGHGTDNAWDESVSLILQSLHLPWDFARDQWSCALTQQEQDLLLSHIEARVEQRIPVAYLTKQAYFCGLRFYVDERTLVPRSPIAQLIEQGYEPWVQASPRRILDMCTGSGCIGIASAQVFEAAQVDLVDISVDALEVAKINVRNFGLEDRVRVIESDGFEALRTLEVPDLNARSENALEQGYDLIVSNPPYVDAQDIASMPDEYHKEPMLGLASGSDGLDFTRKLLSEASEFLNEQGVLIVEVGNSWEALEQAFPTIGFTWLEFEHGGHGVFMLTRDQLVAAHELSK